MWLKKPAWTRSHQALLAVEDFDLSEVQREDFEEN